MGVPYDQANIDNIVNIGNIRVPEHAHEASLAYLRQQGLTVTQNNQALKMIFTCQQPYDQMVLMVCHAILHNHEAHLVGLPPAAHYVAYMLLLAGKLMIKPFSYTNCNMHIGKML